eukprot:CAMPEP_0197190354 /NCGR_PEP_ID=MMETSP1423-20130617/21509_1 /TAXON_ID=476441 /ORGANISM="Pseudo-nitzschia heimii, Strain UNC1101" /LENGTH=53 /DNA_ID=CAMNT_0042642719 /DNA_START=416 /DNA_END=577 /DNA_ORIENTATION=+
MAASETGSIVPWNRDDGRRMRASAKRRRIMRIGPFNAVEGVFQPSDSDSVKAG